jgi:hypothetical protein
VNARIAELEAMKGSLFRQKQKYTTTLITFQASIDRILKEKEELSHDIEERTKEIAGMQSFVGIDIDSEVGKAVQAIRDHWKRKVSEMLRKLTEETARKAATEFSPQIHALRVRHSSELSLLRSKLRSEIDAFNDALREELTRSLNSIREQFFRQTEQQIAIIDRENVKTLDQYRKKGERERSRFESDLLHIRKSTDAQISDIRAKCRRDYEREQHKLSLAIEDCRADIQTAKRQAEREISRSKESLDKYETPQSLIAAEFDLRYESRNKKIIAARQKELEEELDDLKSELDKDWERRNEEKAAEFDHRISQISDEILFLKTEIERTQKAKDKEESYRSRQEKRHVAKIDDLEKVKKLNDQLKDMLFELGQIGEVRQFDESSMERCQIMRLEIEEVHREMEKEAILHEHQIGVMKQKQEMAIARTTDKVKAVITAKDQMAKALNEQVLTVKGKIESLANALHES